MIDQLISSPLDRIHDVPTVVQPVRSRQSQTWHARPFQVAIDRPKLRTPGELPDLHAGHQPVNSKPVIQRVRRFLARAFGFRLDRLEQLVARKQLVPLAGRDVAHAGRLEILHQRCHATGLFAARRRRVEAVEFKQQFEGDESGAEPMVAGYGQLNWFAHALRLRSAMWFSRKPGR